MNDRVKSYVRDFDTFYIIMKTKYLLMMLAATSILISCNMQEQRKPEEWAIVLHEVQVALRQCLQRMRHLTAFF